MGLLIKVMVIIVVWWLGLVVVVIVMWFGVIVVIMVVMVCV